MRRKEFTADTAEDADPFLAEMSYGFLGTVRPDGWPSVTPLNYVYTRGAIYFHGSRIGEKMATIAADNRVSFSVAKEYAIIPSYFSDPEMACPATAYFKSVAIFGRASVVTDLEEKAEALEALMRKLQPEGGYRPISSEDPDYVPRLKGVAVVRIDIESMTGKFKFGQNLKEKERGPLMDRLADRSLPLDGETAELMRKFCPHAGGRTDG